MVCFAQYFLKKKKKEKREKIKKKNKKKKIKIKSQQQKIKPKTHLLFFVFSYRSILIGKSRKHKHNIKHIKNLLVFRYLVNIFGKKNTKQTF